jgi:putative Mn2+ efflux pump MntP
MATFFGLMDIIMMVVGIGSGAMAGATDYILSRRDWIPLIIAAGTIIYFLGRIGFGVWYAITA